MANFALLGDDIQICLIGFFEAHTNSPIYLAWFVAFAAWILPPLLRCRVRIKAKINGKIRKLSPNIQVYLPKEVSEYLRRTRQCGDIARVVWVCISIAFTFTPDHTALTAFIVCAMWLATWVLWKIPCRWIEQNRCWWQLEDEDALAVRISRPAASQGENCKQLLDESKCGERIRDGKTQNVSHLEWHFWCILMKCRIPHLYQLEVPIPEKYRIPASDGSTREHRYIDFALLDPKTGEPVIGIETDESSHFVGENLRVHLKNVLSNISGENFEKGLPMWLRGNKPKDDFEREKEILDASGIAIHRIPEAYWLRGFPPGDLKYQNEIKESQRRMLQIALQERNRVIKIHKEKRDTAPMTLRKRPGFLRRLWSMCTSN